MKHTYWFNNNWGSPLSPYPSQSLCQAFSSPYSDHCQLYSTYIRCLDLTSSIQKVSELITAPSHLSRLFHSSQSPMKLYPSLVLWMLRQQYLCLCSKYPWLAEISQSSSLSLPQFEVTSFRSKVGSLVKHKDIPEATVRKSWHKLSWTDLYKSYCCF